MFEFQGAELAILTFFFDMPQNYRILGGPSYHKIGSHKIDVRRVLSSHSKIVPEML
jgi:hypothetical protein